MSIKQLPADFYTRGNVVEVARDLLGKVLCTRIDGRLTEAMITETEAYAGVDDRASHAYGARRTRRTEPMFQDGGIAYIYLCYGIHHLFNVVTSVRDDPKAVLVRAGNPLTGINEIRARRNRAGSANELLAGPGSLSQALGIRTELSGTSLLGEQIWIEDRGVQLDNAEIVASPRIGVDYAGDDARRPYRFLLTRELSQGQPATAAGPLFDQVR